MSTLTLIGLLLLGAPWIVTLAVVAFGVVVWWTQPRQRTPVTPIRRVRPDAKECPDCAWRQRPDWPACWRCGANMDREPSTHLWV